ncbi:DNA (cytosine-5-)-methyltransferase [Chloroflexota bacterium]
MKEMHNKSLSYFIENLSKWGDENKRFFPWRREKDPFKTLIAELLLQRSRARTVEKVFTQLFSRWPDARSLSKATEEEILEVIKPLGLVNRAHKIKKLSLLIAQTETNISSYEDMIELPGVGRYISGTTANLALGANKPIVDSVSARVYRRFFGLSPFTSAKNIDSELMSLVEIIYSSVKSREFNWYVLDLASEICIPKRPRCNVCPLSQGCLYKRAVDDMTVVELFAGVGGFRLGLDKSSWRVVFSNQWEPGTKKQYASEIYIRHFGPKNHICEDIEKVLDEVESGERVIPDFRLLVGGFPCQDYSVARTLSQATGIQGKKGVLWWQIYRLVSMKKPPIIFLENVDRLLSSPASQRGRDFAIMLACLSDLGYLIEWKIVNAADYGFPQKRRRVFIVGRLIPDDYILEHPFSWIRDAGILAKALPVKWELRQPNLSSSGMTLPDFRIEGDVKSVSDNFGKKYGKTPFQKAGIVYKRDVWTRRVIPNYQRKHKLLKDILLDDSKVDEGFFISESQLEKWIYLKGAKKERRTHKPSGFEYSYNEGAIPFPDNLESPARTILTAEGGSTPSRFKHIILSSSGRYRRLTPIELERLNGFPDDWTIGIPDTRRAFLMGNALVVGVIERIGKVLADKVCEETSGINQ